MSTYDWAATAPRAPPDKFARLASWGIGRGAAAYVADGDAGGRAAGGLPGGAAGVDPRVGSGLDAGRLGGGFFGGCQVGRGGGSAGGSPGLASWCPPPADAHGLAATTSGLPSWCTPPADAHVVAACTSSGFPRWCPPNPADAHGLASVASGVSSPGGRGSSFLRPDWRPPPPPDRVFPPERTINVTYVLKRTHTVVATAVGSRPAPGALVHARPGARAAETAANLRVAAASVAAARPVLGVGDLVERADAGVVTPQAELQQRQLVAQAARLVAVLPLIAIAHAAACSVHALAGMSAERLAHHLVERRPGIWRWSTVRDMVNVWVRWLAWLSRHDVEHDGSSFNAIDLGDFFEEVDTLARAKGPANVARARAADAAAAAAASARGEPPPPPKKWQDGAHALTGVKSSLGMVARHFGVGLPIKEASFGRKPGARARMPTPAFTIGIVFRLYSFVSRVAEAAAVGSVPFEERAHAAVAAAMLFCCFSCNRCEQANSCSFERLVGGYLHGVLLLDKHPNPEKRQARPFWMRVAGFDGSRAWFDFLLGVLAGVEAGCFVFRDFDSQRGDPQEASRFLNSPLVGERLVFAIRCLLVRVCGMGWDESGRWAKHAARHFLMEVAGARVEPALRAVEIGRWSGSTAQDPDLAPSAQLARRHQLRAGVMPEAYAPLSKVARVCGILGDQMGALDALWASPQGRSLPVFGGFEPLAAWPASAVGDD